MFKDPIKPKQKTRDGQKEWDFKAPAYDNRTSRAISAGDDYGIGFRQPVGKEKASGVADGPIPQNAYSRAAENVLKDDVRG